MQPESYNRAMHLLRLILKNALRHRLRTGLTILGIVIAILSFGMLQTLVTAWYEGANLASSTRLVARNAIWTYTDAKRFHSSFISGAQRLASGNTLICEGAKGRVFEVDRDGKVLWDWWSPLGGEIEPSPQGGKAPPKALFRAQRIPRDHAGVKGKL